jgi:predicted site-specific integrase-resolvase
MQPDQLLTRLQLAKLLQISIVTLDRMRKRGIIDIPVISFSSRAVRFRHQDVMDYINKKTKKENKGAS